MARSVAAIQALDRAPDIVKQELERPFAERVLGPLGDQLVGTGRKMVRADTAKKLHYRLNVAGNPQGWDVNRLIGLKVLGLAVLGGVGLLYLLGHGLAVLPGGRSAPALIAAFGYCLPNLLLYNAGTKRETLMRNALPDAIDLLTVSVEAGLGLRRRRRAGGAQHHGSAVARSSPACCRRCRSAWAASDAMRAMAERSSLEDLKSFCLAMVQADSLGIPIGRVLRIQSSEMRTKRRQRAEEKAQQVPVRMMIPLVLFILPCLFIVILGPAGIQIADTFSKM